MARLRVSIVFGSGARIGPGKAKLLESIRDTGSISAAARDMGMSYKRAWLLLDSMHQAFTEPVASSARPASSTSRVKYVSHASSGLTARIIWLITVLRITSLRHSHAQNKKAARSNPGRTMEGGPKCRRF
jgi:molybdate transport repressor ModE-like protein